MKKDQLYQEIERSRKTEHPIHPLILNRWSPRSMTGEGLSNEELCPLFEAARWAPSSYNNQPWRFLYAKRDTAYWDKFFHLLIDFNKKWCTKAAVLGIIVAKKTFDHNNKPSITHAFDTGAAWENFCLEGTHRELVVHGIEGFDYVKARALVPAEFEVLAMFAVGKRAPKHELPNELQGKEEPSTRKKISEIAFEGEMKKSSTP